jgi:mono/diheme cytochrome c family protein
MRDQSNVQAGWLLSVVALALIIVMRAAPGLSQGAADDGKRTAETWCSSCHLVDGVGTAIDGAPPFRAVANDPAKTSSFLRTWLTDPHYPMPNLELSRRQIDDLVAYIESLRGE